MNSIVIFLCISFCGIQWVQSDDKPLISSNINIDSVLKNERLLKSYVDCLLDKKPCTKEGLELKKIIPETLRTRCGKCSETQMKSIRKVIQYIQDQKPDWWKQLLDKFDPDRAYTHQYEAFLNSKTK